MAFVKVESPDCDFWALNPSLKLIKEFKKLIETEGYERSSNILKSIYYVWDPKSNLKDSGLSQDKLKEDMAENLIGDPNFDWDIYEPVVDLYLKFNTSELESMLIHYEKEINDLNTLLGGWTWSKKDVKDKAYAVSQYKSLFDDYIEIKNRVTNEHENIISLEGGYQKSMLESMGN